MWLGVKWDETPLIPLTSDHFSASQPPLPNAERHTPLPVFLVFILHSHILFLEDNTSTYVLIPSLYYPYCLHICKQISAFLAPGSHLSGKPTPTVSQVPAVCCLSHPRPGSALGPALGAFSQTAQEIMEICRVDRAGCEDPDLDTDTTTNALHELQQELRLMTEGTDTHLRYFRQSQHLIIVWPTMIDI